MDDATYRILDILARNLGRPISIHELTGKIEEEYGKTYYANTYEKITKLAQEGIIAISRSGRSSLISLNFEHYLLVDLLAQTDLARKHDFLKTRNESQLLMMELDAILQNQSFIKSITLFCPERNANLNKAEILLHTNSSISLQEMITISQLMIGIQKMHNIKLNWLVLDDESFFDMLKSTELNLIKQMLFDKISIFNPQIFWSLIRRQILQGSTIISDARQTTVKINDADLYHNLARFGYVEFGPIIKQAEQICIEYIIISILFQNDARRVDAIPVILAKNLEKTNYGLLLFLARKYALEGKLLGILKALRNLVMRDALYLDEPIKLLEAMKIREIKANQKRIQENLKTYNVT